MAIKIDASPILILNGIPLVLNSSYVHFENIESSNSSNTNIIPKLGETYLLGSSVPFIQDKVGAFVSQNYIKTFFSVSFFVESKGFEGKSFNNILLPLIQLTRRVLDIPCQFIGYGYYMFLGYLSDFSTNMDTVENKRMYNLSFTENIHKLYSEDEIIEKTPFIDLTNTPNELVL